MKTMKTMKTNLMALSALSLALFSPATFAAVGQFSVAPGSTATFEAIGKPSMLKIKGHGAKVDGQLALEESGAKGKFVLDLNEFDTGLSLRNKHMKEKYLDTAAHPKALLEIDQVDLPKGWSPGTDVNDAKFKGRLTLKGVTKPVEGKVKVSGPSMATRADFAFSLNDFPIGVPSYMGVTVADLVNVSVDIPSFARK